MSDLAVVLAVVMLLTGLCALLIGCRDGGGDVEVTVPGDYTHLAGNSDKTDPSDSPDGTSSGVPDGTSVPGTDSGSDAIDPNITTVPGTGTDTAKDPDVTTVPGIGTDTTKDPDVTTVPGIGTDTSNNPEVTVVPGTTTAPAVTTAPTPEVTEPVHTHVWSEWTITKAPTCTEKGSRERSCECGYKQTETVAATGHTSVTDKAVAPTCGKTGLTAGKHCSVCGEVLTAQKEVAALEHKYSGGVCTRCGEQEPSEGLELTLNSDGKTYAVSGIGTCTETSVSVPYTYKGKPVTAILDSAFAGNTKITKVVIPESIVSVGKFAFSGCTALKEVKIYVGVVRIDTGAFAGNTVLKSIALPDSVTFVGDMSFSGCTGLSSIDLGEGVLFIGSNAFSNTAYYNKTANRKNGALYIGKYLIDVDKTLTGNFNVASETQAIATGAFLNCSGLKSIKLSESLKGMGDNVFSGCSALEELYIPASVVSIGKGVIGGCSALTILTVDRNNQNYYSYANCVIDRDSYTLIAGCAHATIPATGVTVIDEYAFANITSLTSIVIPNSVVSIGDHAFAGCSGLLKAQIGTGVKEIGTAAFESCTSLKDIIVYDGIRHIGNRAFSNTGYCNDNRDASGVAYIGKYLVDTLDTTSGLYYVKEGTLLIADNAFKSRKLLIAVEIPKSVVSIGAGAFGDCTELLRVKVGSGVTSIGKDAFKGCSKLANAEFSVTSGWTRSDGKVISATSLTASDAAAQTLLAENAGYGWSR